MLHGQLCRWQKGHEPKPARRPLDAGKGKQVASPSDLPAAPRENTAGDTVIFSVMRPTVDFGPAELWDGM